MVMRAEDRRTEAVRGILQETGIGAVLVTDPYHLRYLSGFRGGEGMLYISADMKVLITDSRYTEAAGRESDYTVEEESASRRRETIVRECLGLDGAARVGYEDEDLRCSTFAALKEKLPEVAVWVPVKRRISDLRRIKDRRELEALANAEAVGDAAFADILEVLRPGMTEKEAAAELEYRMKQHGADGFSFDTIVASGPNSSMPHAIPTDRPFANGDFVTMDFGCIFDGYCSDMTRTVVIGRADEKQKEIYGTVLRAQEACLAHLRAGITGREADAYARDIIREAGYGERFGHGTGHGVGLFIHEEPRISPNDGTVLQAGMVETVEPGIYLPGFGGVRIEDMVVITEDGCRNLTSSPKELIEL